MASEASQATIEALRRAAERREAAALLLARGSTDEAASLAVEALEAVRSAAGALDGEARPTDLGPQLADAERMARELGAAPKGEPTANDDREARVRASLHLTLSIERRLRPHAGRWRGVWFNASSAFVRDAARAAVAWSREYVTLAHAEARCTAAGAERARHATRLAEVRALRDAARDLWADGKRAPAVRLASKGLEAVVDVGRGLGEGDALDPSTRRRLEEANGLSRELAGAPAAEGDLGASHEATLTRALRTLNVLEPALRALTLDSAALARRRRVHRAIAILALGGVAAALVLAVALRFAPRARASSELGTMFAADFAIDGDVTTDWVPDGGDGQWLDVRVPRRPLRHIRIVDGHVMPDRAARTLVITAYRGADVVGTFHASFPAAHPAAVVTLDAAGLRCDRLHFAIASHYGAGGALSEVTFD